MECDKNLSRSPTVQTANCKLKLQEKELETNKTRLSKILTGLNAFTCVTRKMMHQISATGKKINILNICKKKESIAFFNEFLNFLKECVTVLHVVGKINVC